MTGRSKSAVKDKLKVARRELDAGIQSSQTYTVALCIEDWLSQGLAGRSADTVANYGYKCPHWHVTALECAFVTFGPAAARGGLPNLVKALVGAAVGVIVMSRLAQYAAGLCVAGYGALQFLGRQAGSTRTERRQSLAGDGAVLHPHAVTDHAITIGAPPEAVWPWLTQMGWHLGGYYTPRWVDRLLFPANWPSADVLDPGLVRELAVGDTVPDGPPGTAWYVVEEVGPPSTLVLHSTTHIPPSWRAKFGAAVDWTWSFHLAGIPDDRTRLHVRVRGRAAPWWLAAAYIAAIIPADFIMATGMLRGLKHRAEQHLHASVPVRPAASPG